MNSFLIPSYKIRKGSTLDRALLVKFMQLTYQDIFPNQDFSHLSKTVEQYLSSETPLWWVNFTDSETLTQETSPVACLWMGNAIDQITGQRHAHLFLLYVVAEHRRRGVGRALMEYAQTWARARGDKQIGLQVFSSNTPALNLYNQLGFQTQSLWMIKPLENGE